MRKRWMPFGRRWASRRMITWEVLAFSAIILMIWIDEIIDVPHVLLDAEATPVNWRESLLESGCIAGLGVLVVIMTRRLFGRIRYLEGIVPVCASCKKIRDENGRWQPIEIYIVERSEAEFSHGLCPECAGRYFPEEDKDPRP